MADQSPLENAGEIDIPEPYLIAIGKSTVAWGNLETAVELSIVKLAGIDMYDPRGAILTAHMTWPLKMDILESLAKSLSKQRERLSQFGDVKPLLSEAQKARNKIAHGQWVYDGGKVYHLRMTARGKLKVERNHIPLSDIEGGITEINKAGAALLYLVFGE